MIRKTFYIDSAKEKYLKSLGGNVSEHIRRAIDEYIEKKSLQNVNISPSKHGR